MPEQGSTTLLRGFQVSVAVLDAFLVANNVDETYGTPPFYKDHPDHDPISKLLLAKIARFDEKADKTKFRVILPSVEGDDIATTAYVTYAWVSVEVHREVNMDLNLPAEPQKGLRSSGPRFWSLVTRWRQRRGLSTMGRWVCTLLSRTTSGVCVVRYSRVTNAPRLAVGTIRIIPTTNKTPYLLCIQRLLAC
jgi:hypothetical protein